MKFNQCFSHFLLLTLCIAINAAQAKPQQDSLNGGRFPTNEVSYVSSQLLDKLTNITESVSQRLADVLGRGLGDYFDSLRSLLEKLTKNLADLQGIMVHQTLEQVRDVLKQISSSKELIDQALTDATGQLETNVQHKQVQLKWNNWAKGLLERVAESTDGNEEAVDGARNVIYQLESSYASNLSSCYDSVENLQTQIQFEVDMRFLFQENIRALDEEIAKCLKTISYYFLAERRCRIAVERKLSPLKQLPREMNFLREGLQQLVGAIAEGNKCVASTLII